jgi:hypothetical protein
MNIFVHRYKHTHSEKRFLMRILKRTGHACLLKRYKDGELYKVTDGKEKRKS